MTVRHTMAGAPLAPAEESLESRMYFEPFYVSLYLFSRPRPDWNKYLEVLERGVAAGDDHACYALGRYHLHGLPTRARPVPRDVARGYALLRRASRSVHMAMTELASLQESGELGVRVNERKAFRLFEQAVTFGSVTARFHLGRCYYSGTGTRRDPAKARRLFRAAAKLGFPVPEEALHGEALPEAHTMEKRARKAASAAAVDFIEPFSRSILELARDRTDWKQHHREIEAGVAAGDDFARYALSSHFLHGRLGRRRSPHDVARGLQLLRKASRSVHMAMTELAMHHESGELGLRVNERKAFRLFEQAVTFGSITARFHLGRCYYSGTGTRRDLAKARRLLRAAAKLGFPVPEEALRAVGVNP